MKKAIKSLLFNLIGGVVGCGLVLGFFYILGLVMQLMETFPILIVILGIVDIILIFKEI